MRDLLTCCISDEVLLLGGNKVGAELVWVLHGEHSLGCHGVGRVNDCSSNTTAEDVWGVSGAFRSRLECLGTALPGKSPRQAMQGLGSRQKEQQGHLFRMQSSFLAACH